MIYIRINNDLYPATIRGRMQDKDWGNRDSLAVTLEMTYEQAIATFADDMTWGHVYQGDSYINENGETITPDSVEYDDSDYCVAGPITDNRNGTVTVKMGKKTELETTTEERDQALSDLEDVMLIAYGGI